MIPDAARLLDIDRAPGLLKKPQHEGGGALEVAD